MEQRKFKNQPGYVFFLSKWRKVHTLKDGATPHPEPASPISPEVISKGKERDDFSQSNDTDEIVKKYKREKYEELKDISLDIEQELREDCLDDDHKDMGWEDFLEVFDLYTYDEEMFDELDSQLGDFIEDFGLFGEVPNTVINNWRINRVSKTGDNKELVSRIQKAVDDYLEGIPVSYDIDGDITPYWSSEWGDYPGNVPLISFSDVVSTKEDLDKIITVVDALGGRRIYVASGSDMESDDDEFNTNILARIIPEDEQNDNTAAHYLVSKEEDGEENFYIYTKDATFPTFTYPSNGNDEVYSSVDRDRERKSMKEIESRDSAHRLWKSAAFYSMEDALKNVAQSGKCREASVKEWKNAVKLAQNYILGDPGYAALFASGDMNEDIEKMNRRVFFERSIEEINKRYESLGIIEFDTINTIRGHHEKSEWDYQKIETYASMFLDEVRHSQLNLTNETDMDNDAKFDSIINATKEFAQDSARSLIREGSDFLDEFRNGPTSAILNAAGSVTSALHGRRRLKEELQGIVDERSEKDAEDEAE